MARRAGDGYTWDGGVVIDARLGLAAARGELSHAAHRLYVAICHHRHGLTAGISDRELAAWAAVNRNRIPALLAELREKFPDALSVVRRQRGRNSWTKYLVPLPPRSRADNGVSRTPNGNGVPGTPNRDKYGASQAPLWHLGNAKRTEVNTPPLPPHAPVGASGGSGQVRGPTPDPSPLTGEGGAGQPAAGQPDPPSAPSARVPPYAPADMAAAMRKALQSDALDALPGPIRAGLLRVLERAEAGHEAP